MQAPRGGAQGAATPRSLISFDPRQTGFVAAVRRRASLLISVFVLLAVLHKYDYLIFATRLVLIGGALFLYMLFSSQSRMLYAPQPDPRLPRETSGNPPPYRSPADMQMAHEEVGVVTQDGVKLHGWLIKAPADAATQPTIIFFHGNAGNIGYRMPNFKMLVDVLRCNVLAFDYRGYGDSDVVPAIDEAGLHRDCRAVLAFAAQRADIDKRKVFIFGRSLGGAVGIYAAATAREVGLPIAGVMLENTFTSVADMALHIFPFLRPIAPIVHKLVVNKWPSIDMIRHVQQPMLFLSGDIDALVPPAQMRALFAAAPSEHKSIHVVRGGNHNDTFMVGGPAYLQAMSDFVQRCLSQ